MKKSALTICLFLTLLSSLCFSETIIIDNDYGEAVGYKDYGTWILSTRTGYNGGKYWYTHDYDEPSSATWTPTIINPGLYEVKMAFRKGTDRTTDAPIKIIHADGENWIHLNMYGSNVQTISLGKYFFDAGTSGTVQLFNNGGTGVYISDTVIFESAEDKPPVIANIIQNPPYPTYTDNVYISASITDDLQLKTSSLFYNVSSQKNYSPIDMYDDGNHNDESAGDNIYGCTIPPQNDGSIVSYYIQATDNLDQKTTSSLFSYIVGVPPPKEYRCIWADSWGRSFLNQSEAEEIVNTCRNNNINTIMIEVRKIGDAYYKSNIEPRATNITGGADYDPLGYLINLAHDTSGGKKYIQVHAWFVMHRISKGETLDSKHVLVQHPEYIMSDSNGNTIGDGNKYIDPGHPGTVDHNVAVILDCMKNYDIDGVNLDYIRYPEATGYWGYNPVSVQRFNSYYEKTGNPSSSDPDWSAWRRECVTNEVKKIYIKMMMEKPHVVLTPDTINWGYSYTDQTYPVSSAYAGVFQDWVGWLKQGIIDYNAQMGYSTDYNRYKGWMDLSLKYDDKRGSIIGIGAYMQTSIQNSMDQLLLARESGAAGINIYDWYSEASAAGGNRTLFYLELKKQVCQTWTDPPSPSWKTNPTTSIIQGNVTFKGIPIDHATVELDGIIETRTNTDGSGWYGILEISPGSHLIKFSKKGYRDLPVRVNVEKAGMIITLDVDMSCPTGWYTH